MKPIKKKIKRKSVSTWLRAALLMMAALIFSPFNLFSVSLPSCQTPVSHSDRQTFLPDSIPLGIEPVGDDSEVVEEEFTTHHDRLHFEPVDTVNIEVPAYIAADSLANIGKDEEWVRRRMEFNPDPQRAVWLAALFPGLGQIYNRRYWKLPLIVGGYLGLGYATNWNNNQLRDYTRAFADLTDNDPSTKSYMDLFPTTVKEEDLDKTWLTNLLRSRKNYFRRNRDLCIISMVAVYLVAIVDAYVDASLAHFDISPDISMDIYPSLIQDGRTRLPSFGLQWALNF